MGQFQFVDADRRPAAISARGDRLEIIARVVPFGSFGAEIAAAVLTPAKEKKSNAGRNQHLEAKGYIVRGAARRLMPRSCRVPSSIIAARRMRP